MSAPVRMLQDNVLIRLDPPENVSRGGVHLPENRQRPGGRESRTATVLAVGPGYYQGCRECGCTSVFVRTELKPGDRVVVDALAGQDYVLDVSVPRHNKGADFLRLLDERGEFRIAREGEILAVIDDAGERVEAAE